MKKIRISTFIILFIFSLSSVTISADSTFSDLKLVPWADDEILYLHDQEVVNGLPDGTFGVNKNIKRGDAALMLARAKDLDLEAISGKSSFPDVKESSYYFQAIEASVQAGYLNGHPNGNFGPEDPLTRAQMAKIIAEAFNLESDGKNYFHDISTSWAKDYINTLAANGISNGKGNGSFAPNANITRAEFSVMLARAMNDTFKIKIEDEKDEEKEDPKPNDELSTSEIVALNDDKVVMIETNRGLGSGVIVANGLILTNEHVISGMTSGTVILHNGAEYEIEGIVEKDETKDLALIKTKVQPNIDPVTIATSSSVSKGDNIVAIGSPHGFQNTVSEGLVSAFRTIEGVSYIQISAPIDHGSSGGGLFNKKGELVGITTSRYDSNADLNFAVAIEEASNWYKYFDMPFEAIEVLPIDQGTSILIPELQNIALGMSKEQIKSIETAPLLFEEHDTIYYTKKIFDYTADVGYIFEDNQLTEIHIFHHVADYATFDILESYFLLMHDNLYQLYGDPLILDVDWFDDSYDYSISALWALFGYDLFLSANVEYDYSTYGGISILVN